MKGLFINSKHSKCSIYESGLMCYKTLLKCNDFTLDYIEEFKEQIFDYDFYVINWHPSVNNWVSKNIIDAFFKGKTFCIVTEVSTDVLDRMPGTPDIFDYYIFLDPTIEETKSRFAFPRPLESVKLLPTYIDLGYPVIGTFGFATHGKRWDLIIKEVQNEFDTALIKINIPHATYVPDSEINVPTIKKQCNDLIFKKGIKLEFTSDYMSKDDLIHWCALNTINCFFYYRGEVGLAAVTDQAISARRPLLVSENSTFRHILKYIDPYPKQNLKEAINSTKSCVDQMCDDWSSENFNNKFRNILYKND